MTSGAIGLSATVVGGASDWERSGGGGVQKPDRQEVKADGSEVV